MVFDSSSEYFELWCCVFPLSIHPSCSKGPWRVGIYWFQAWIKRSFGRYRTGQTFNVRLLFKNFGYVNSNILQSNQALIHFSRFWPWQAFFFIAKHKMFGKATFLKLIDLSKRELKPNFRTIPFFTETFLQLYQGNSFYCLLSLIFQVFTRASWTKLYESWFCQNDSANKCKTLD